MKQANLQQTSIHWIACCSKCNCQFATPKNFTFFDDETGDLMKDSDQGYVKVEYCQVCEAKIARSPLNRVYGRLTVMGAAKAGKWLCQCECGNTTEVHLTNLTQGRTISCGCRRDELNRERQITKNEGKIAKIKDKIGVLQNEIVALQFEVNKLKELNSLQQQIRDATLRLRVQHE